MERNRIELKQAETKRIEEQKKRLEQQRQKAEEQKQKAEQQSQNTEERKTQGKTAKKTIPPSPKQQPSPTPTSETTDTGRKNTPNDKKTGRSVPKSNNQVSKVNNPPKDKSKINESNAKKRQATQPRGRRNQNSPIAPATDETTEHPIRPSRSSILRQRKTLSPQTLEQSSSNPKSTRSKTSEGAPTSESRNALNALAENIAKLTKQKSQQDNHPIYTQADVENFLRKSDNEVTIEVRGGDVTINGNPL